MLARLHPAVANRNCWHCLDFDYDEKTGRPRKGRDGQYEKRLPNCPAPCRRAFVDGESECPKGTPENSRALTEANKAAYEHYLECRAVGVFPDDPIVSRNARVIRDVEDQIAEKRQAEFEMSVISAVACQGG